MKKALSLKVLLLVLCLTITACSAMAEENTTGESVVRRLF